VAHSGNASCGGATRLAALALVATGVAGSTTVAASAPAVGVPPAWHIMQEGFLPGAMPDNGLFGISCASPGSCVAVGDEGYSTAQRPLVETLRGGAWKVTASPGTPVAFPVGFLNSVSCISMASCVAAGWASDPNGVTDRTLIETSRGGSWKVSRSPNLTTLSNDLRGISCSSAAACVAVGDYGVSSSQKTLIETLKRVTWTVATSPSAPSPFTVDFLNGVSCISATHCVAAGFAATSTAMQSRTLIETLGVGGWKITPSPNTASPLNELYGISCSSPVSCVAVGDAGTMASQKTLIETLSDGSWRVTSSPNTTGALNTLYYARCRSSTTCVAAGYGISSTGTATMTLIETLTQGRWRIARSPNTSSPLNELYGYACAAPTACYAVGLDGYETEHNALIEATAGTGRRHPKSARLAPLPDASFRSAASSL
jgi:hypothetical protein